MSLQKQQQTDVEPATPAPEPVQRPIVQESNSDAIASMPKAEPGPVRSTLAQVALAGGEGDGGFSWAKPVDDTGSVQKVAQNPVLGPEAQPGAKPFTSLGIDGQMGYMARLFQDNRALLDANGVSSHLERKMAAQVPRELGENSRRASLSNSFQDAGMSLRTKLGGKDPNDPEALRKVKLSEEERFLLGKVQAGTLDLSALGATDKARAANLEQYADLGVDLRKQQYAEMEGLRKRKEGGEKLSKEEAARLGQLQGKSTFAGARMGDLWGMSADRFGDIYAKGNTRFESRHFQNLRSSYFANEAARKAQLAAHEQNPDKVKAPKDTVVAGSGIGNFAISTAGQQKIASGNVDLLADIATSYGAGQVMGGYAASPDWQGVSPTAERLQPIQLPDGTSYTPSFDDLKHAGRQHDPDAGDLRLQMSLLKMGLAKKPQFDPKGQGLGNDNISNDAYIRMYNGHKPGDPVYEQYMDSLTTNAPIYDREKKNLLDAGKGPADPKSLSPQAPRKADAGLVQLAALEPKLLGEPTTLSDAAPAPALVVRNADTARLAADVTGVEAAPGDTAKAEPTRDAKIDPSVSPAAAAFQDKLTKEYTPLLKALEDAKTDDERQKAALAVAGWNRANLIQQPDVQAYLARSDVPMEEKTATMNALALEAAKSEFLAGWAYQGGVNTNRTWENDGTNAGAFPSAYLDALKTPKDDGENSPWCTSFAGFAMKQAGFQFNPAAKTEGFSPFWSGSRLDAWARTGKNTNGKVTLTPNGERVVDSTSGGRHDTGFGALTSGLKKATDKKGNVLGGDTIAGDFASANGGFQPGDVIVLDKNNAVQGASHTVMVDTYDPETQTLTTIEGNADNKVTSRRIDLKDPKHAAMLASRTRVGAESFMTPETKAQLAAKSAPTGAGAMDAATLLARARSTNGALAASMGKKGWLGSTDPNASVYDWAGAARTKMGGSDR